jgi:hypothetical protein
MSERRYTDQEVTRLLQRAADLDRDSAGGAVARGLSLTELREIAAEVGIDPTMVTRAATEVSTSGPSRAGRLLLGEAPVVRRTSAVPVRLSREALGRLVEVVDAEMPAQGTVGEALGAVRWTSSNRFVSRQVVMQPGDAETVVRVEERFTDRIRAVIHLIPATYGAGGGLALGSELLGAVGPGIPVALAGAALGFGLGRAIWKVLRRASSRRVESLTDKLGEEAAALSESSTTP